MTIFDHMIASYQFNRGRTLGLLDEIAKRPDARETLAFRPGPGRAHIGWQLMHVGVTEELFASERLAPDKKGEFTDLWPRFRGGSTPDDDVPSAADIRRVLDASREHLLDTLGRFGEKDLGMIPEALKARGLTLRDVLHILSWHEAHHQGQAHITLNLYKASRA